MKNIILQRIKNENYAFRPYGICLTAAGAQEKIVNITCPDKTDNSIVFSLLEGATVLVEFQNANSAANATLNVNNTGAKPIFYNGVALTETWQSRELVEFFYDGTNWNVLNTLGLSGSSSDETKIPVATSEVLGGIKVGYEENGRNYPVELSEDNKAFVNVPAGNAGTVTSITPGTGLTGTSSDAAITSSGTINLKPATTNEIGGVKFQATYNSGVTLATTGSNLNTRSYGLCCDQDGVAFVNVPWTDNDTKNTTGSSNSSSILYIIGATSQNSSGVQTYSNSNIKIQNNAVYASGGFFESSDERLKDFGEKVSVDLDKLSELKKNYFTWRDSENKEQQLGVSAQEIRELYPEIVSEQENGTLVVAYDKLSVIALAAIDELYKKNQELEKRLTALENKLK